MQTRNALIIILFILISVTVSCKNRRQQIDLVQQASFNQAIIADFTSYKKLNDLIVEHMDTIIKFRKAQLDHPGEVEEFHFLHDNEKENSFIQKDINFSNMPKFIFPKLDSAFYSIKKGNISGFSITTRGMVDMSVEHTYSEKTNCDTYGSLVWQMPKDLPLISTAKDTLLRDQCRYILHVVKRGNP
ncbi:hypothetical protein ACFOG5_08335 [Pedobacter fastidiosus]|uniref:Lipoprotein n=1 Tax=Pedobacter fastidiosus TaxID=2765361 RepID=A0ABR7KQ49_9SPHI|nr:hypothetical protein [Pedobacter fastidiosus]MBC6109838.1 hypothetical protein [Pedobacter fastidiosus]